MDQIAFVHPHAAAQALAPRALTLPHRRGRELLGNSKYFWIDFIDLGGNYV
jgi:hypothetical protein